MIILLMDYIPRAVLETPFRRLGRRALIDRLHAMRALAEVRGVRYLDDAGRARGIDIALKPWVLTSGQLLVFHRVAMRLSDALLRVAHLYGRLEAVREIVHFDPVKESWMRLASHPRSRPLAVIGRLDSTAVYDHRRWRADFRMLEPNAVGVGGVHYAPAACSITMDVVGDLLAQALPGRAITATPDPRQLLLGELHAVAWRLRRPLRAVALIENTDFTTGTDEFRELADDLTARGIKAVVADPRELRLSRGRVTAKGLPVDLLYRDSELSEFVAMESEGRRLTALRQAIREGRLISGLTWEFDQKSVWEVFTDPRFAGHFTPEQRALFRSHLLWTRVVRERRATDPAGREVDLLPFIRRNRERLVLKPSTMFGGEGVVIGLTVRQGIWERELARALRSRERHVVQQLAHIPTDHVPMLTASGVQWSERCVVSGFFFSSSGIGLVGRFSSLPVVNVSRGGGLLPALWVH
jgi:hypothetical protein